jgi:hypothetical protein
VSSVALTSASYTASLKLAMTSSTLAQPRPGVASPGALEIGSGHAQNGTVSVNNDIKKGVLGSTSARVTKSTLLPLSV